MTLENTPVDAQQRTVSAAPAVRKGPTPLDPADFKFVSGGSPRTGWPTSAEGLIVSSDDTGKSPRTGW